VSYDARRLRGLFAVVALLVLLVGFAAGRPLRSDAASISYCGEADGRYTPAHGWCYASWPGILAPRIRGLQWVGQLLSVRCDE
jgi:hypothetical protein